MAEVTSLSADESDTLPTKPPGWRTPCQHMDSSCARELVCKVSLETKPFLGTALAHALGHFSSRGKENIRTLGSVSKLPERGKMLYRLDMSELASGPKDSLDLPIHARTLWRPVKNRHNNGATTSLDAQFHQSDVKA